MNFAEKQFLACLFAGFNDSGVRYAVLRNCDSLPESLGGSDLDVLAQDFDDADKICRVSQKVARACGGVATVIYRTDAIVICLAGHVAGGWWGCHIDIFAGLCYYGHPYVDARMLLDNRKLMKESFYCLGDEMDVISLVKELLYTRQTRKDYYPKARAYYRVRPTEVKDLFAKYFSRRGWELLRTILEEERSADELRLIARKLSRTIRTTIISALANRLHRITRVFRRPGFAVAFLGTDGSGKSTLIETLRPTLEAMLHSKLHYEHLRPNLLPPLSRLAGRPQTMGPVTNPHGGQSAGWVGSMIRFFYYYVDYVLGYWIKTYPVLVRRPTLVVFDRYYYEYMIDPQRCAVRLLPGFARFFSWFIPKPDLILCLGGSPEIIFARKPETTLEEVSRQVMALRRFCSGNKRGVWIDTTVGVENSRDNALRSIVEAMAGRYRK